MRVCVSESQNSTRSHVSAQALQGVSKKLKPVEDNIEATCMLMKTAGKQLDSSPRAMQLMPAYFNAFNSLSRDRNLSARTRFMCRDILDLRAER